MKKLLSFLLIVALLMGLLSPMAFAATVGVTSYSDLVTAIGQAPTDGTVTTIELENSFSATGGVLPIAAGQNIVLTSAAGSTFTFTQATAGQRHFSVAGNLTLQNVTLSGSGGGTTGGGVDVSGGTLTVEAGGTITNCRAPGGASAAYGGAVHVFNQGAFIMNDGAISNNSSSWAGGGVFLEGNSTFNMTGGVISENTSSSSGGGVEIRNGYGTISGGVITSNTATSAVAVGGGIELKAANLSMSGGLITNNRTVYGGGIHTDASGLVMMTGGTVSDNVANGNGGGIFSSQNSYSNPLPNNSYNNLTIGTAVIFSGNVAGNGARVPPPNVATATHIATSSSSIFNNPLNNADINYYNSGAMVTSLTVTFDQGANGIIPNGPQIQQSIPTTNSPLVPTIVPTPQPNASYGFIGWSPDGGITILTSAQVLTTPLANNTTYVAQYAPPITLIFDGQGGTPASQTATQVQVTGTYANALSQVTIPTLANNVFRGWFTTPNGDTSGVQILPTSIVAIGTPDMTTLYAWWIPNPTVTITFDGNGGTPTPQIVPGRVVGNSYAATLAAVTTPTLTGNVFNGWNTAADGTGAQITASDTIPAVDTTLYAQWMPLPTITITYLAQGGTPDGQQQTVVTGNTYGNASPAISPPTKMGYAFVGWFTAPTGGVQILPTTIVTATTDQYLYAQWVAVTVTITFDAQGGTPTPQVVSGLAPLSSFAPALAAIATPTRPNYIFQGWYDQPQGTGGSSVTSGRLIPPMDMTVYAWWTPAPTITVTFNAMGGTPTMETQSVTTGNTYAVALAAVPEPSLPGSVFSGWFTAPAGGVQILDTTVVTVTTNQTLYARWTPTTVTLMFDAQGGTPAMQVVSGQAVGSTYAAALAAITTPTQIGYTFYGWFDAPTGGNQIMDSDTVPAVDTTIYAQWTPIPPITVTFDSQGGVFDPAYIIHGAGTTLSSDFTLAYHTPVTIGGTFMQAMAATADPNPPNDGNTYYFGGWWTTPNGDTSGEQILPTSTVWNPAPAAGITLYVHWDLQVTVTLTFDANGGTPTPQVRRGAIPDMEILASTFIQDPTWMGYTFVGWFTAPSGGTQIGDTDPVPGTDTTYYAQWTQIPPITVTFDAQGGTFDPADAIPGDGTTFSPDYLFAYHTPVTIGGTFMQAMAATPNPYPPNNGFSFGGWWTTPNGDATGVQILPTSTVWDPTPAAEITLYAHWIPVPTVTVTFAGNGGTPATQVVPGELPGDTFATPLAAITTPTQSGFIFNGWADISGNPITADSLIPPENITVYAQWIPNPTFAVTFDAQGGTPATQTANVTTGGTYAAAMTAVTNPTLAGFLFQGWFTEPNGVIGGVQVLYTTVVTATAPQTLYAHWIANPTITITFNGNGGTPTAQVVPGRVSGDTYAATFAAITTPTRDGYIFAGWFTTAAATGGMQITATSIVPAGAIDRVVYARWAPIPTIIITFDAQGGTPDPQTASVETGVLYEDALSQVVVPARPGYVFVGWFTTPDGDMSGVQILADTTVTATTNQTLYAHWIAVGVTITFDAQGGIPATQVVPGKMPGDTYAISLVSATVPTREFYAFQGWFTAPTGGTKITDTDTVPTTDTTLYAQWEPIQIIIRFDALGAAPAMQEEPATTGNTFAAPLAAAITPTMDGNTFVGWFTQVIGGVQVSPMDIVTQTTDQTLYARFTPTPLPTVTFDANGGTPAIQTAAVTVGDSYETAFSGITTPARAGYTFLGWFTDAAGGTRVLASDLVVLTSDHTLYAHWAAGQFRGDVTLTEVHYAYLIGEGHNHIAPNDFITRAEVASALLRIISDETRAAFWTLENPFPDVPNNGGAWFSNAISVANSTGIMTGFPDGTFRPGQHMTRAEVVTALTRYLANTQYDGTVDLFPDISTSWARDSINLAAQLGWVHGDQHGYFNPNASITRAEVITIINRVLNRTAVDIDTANMNTWADNPDTNAWFYWAVQIGSNSALGAPVRNWAALQLPNARAEDAIV